MTLRLYINGTAGQRDGTPISGTDSLGSLLAGNVAAISALDTAQNLFVREDVGYRTYAEVTANVLNSAKTDDADYTLTDADQTDAASLNLGYVGDVNVPLSIKQLVGKSDRTAYLRLTYGGAPVALPAITAGPSISAVTATGCTITAAFNASVTGAKYIVKTNNSAPSAGDWSGASAFTSPQSVTGLTNATLYYVFVRVVDAIGFETVSAAQSFTTGTASNLAPSFTSQPATKAGTLTTYGLTVEYGASDSDGDTITHEISTDNGSNYAVASAVLNGGTGKYEIVVSGLTPNTAYNIKVRLSDTGHSGSNGTASNTLAVTTNALGQVGTVTVTPGDTIADLSWPSVTGAAGYDIEHDDANDFVGATATTSTLTSKQITGLSNGAARYFRVRAYDAADNKGAWSATVSATPTASIYWSDDFGDASIDSALWGTSVTGSATITEANGELTMDSTAANADLAMAYSKKDIKRTSASGKLRVDFKQPNTASGSAQPIALYQTRQTDAATFDAATNRVALVQLVAPGAGGTMFLRYVDNAGVSQYWTGSAWTATSTALPNLPNQMIWDANETGYVQIELDHANSRLRFIVTHNENAYTTTTTWVNYSGVRDNAGDLLALYMTDNAGTAGYKNVWTNVAYSALA